MDLNKPSSLGAWLLRRARDHGLTGSQLADLLGLPVHRIRQITTTADLDDLPVRTVRAMADALGMTWPDWLQPTSAPEPDTSVDRTTYPTSDANRVHAVLALVLGRTLRLDQIADVLDWPPERVQHAVTQLAPLTRGHRGLRLIAGDDQAQLTVSPRTIDHDTRQRLHRGWGLGRRNRVAQFKHRCADCPLR